MVIYCWSRFYVKCSLFWTVKLSTNADTDKYKYSGYDIGFDTSVRFLLFDGSGFGQKVIVFGADEFICAFW